MKKTDPPVNTGRNQDGRFRKGASGNPSGKPKGARHRTTIAIEELMGDHGENVTLRVLERAIKHSDMTAAKLVLERICPPRRGRPVKFKLPAITDIGSVLQAHAELLRLVGTGTLTAEEAQPISDLLTAHLKAVESTEIAARLAEVERQMGVKK
jgi:Family of unknown function (DUF5681)